MQVQTSGIARLLPDALIPWQRLLLEAYGVLVGGGVIIVPTQVGYTMATTAAGVALMKALKGRPEAKPCGLLGTAEVYAALFGEAPAPVVPENLCLAFLGHPTGRGVATFVPSACIGPDGKVGLWLHLGPVHAYLADRLWQERREVIVGTSCNKAGEGNPRADRYNLAALDPDLCARVDLAVAIPIGNGPSSARRAVGSAHPSWICNRVIS